MINMNYLKELEGQPWSCWEEIIGDSLSNPEPNISVRKRAPPDSSSCMKLQRSDMAIYGLCPKTEIFKLIVCNICGKKYKYPAFEEHIRIRHPVNTDKGSEVPVQPGISEDISLKKEKLNAGKENVISLEQINAVGDKLVNIMKVDFMDIVSDKEILSLESVIIPKLKQINIEIYNPSQTLQNDTNKEESILFKTGSVLISKNDTINEISCNNSTNPIGQIAHVNLANSSVSKGGVRINMQPIVQLSPLSSSFTSSTYTITTTNASIDENENISNDQSGSSNANCDVNSSVVDQDKLLPCTESRNCTTHSLELNNSGKSAVRNALALSQKPAKSNIHNDIDRNDDVIVIDDDSDNDNSHVKGNTKTNSTANNNVKNSYTPTSKEEESSICATVTSNTLEISSSSSSSNSSSDKSCCSSGSCSSGSCSSSCSSCCSSTSSSSVDGRESKNNLNKDDVEQPLALVKRIQVIDKKPHLDGKQILEGKQTQLDCEGTQIDINKIQIDDKKIEVNDKQSKVCVKETRLDIMVPQSGIKPTQIEVERTLVNSERPPIDGGKRTLKLIEEGLTSGEKPQVNERTQACGQKTQTLNEDKRTQVHIEKIHVINEHCQLNVEKHHVDEKYRPCLPVSITNPTILSQMQNKVVESVFTMPVEPARLETFHDIMKGTFLQKQLLRNKRASRASKENSEIHQKKEGSEHSDDTDFSEDFDEMLGDSQKWFHLGRRLGGLISTKASMARANYSSTPCSTPSLEEQCNSILEKSCNENDKKVMAESEIIDLCSPEKNKKDVKDMKKVHFEKDSGLVKTVKTLPPKQVGHVALITPNVANNNCQQVLLSQPLNNKTVSCKRTNNSINGVIPAKMKKQDSVVNIVGSVFGKNEHNLPVMHLEVANNVFEKQILTATPQVPTQNTIATSVHTGVNVIRGNTIRIGSPRIHYITSSGPLPVSIQQVTSVQQLQLKPMRVQQKYQLVTPQLSISPTSGVFYIQKTSPSSTTINGIEDR